jgi:membrane-associated phospholipid phosphatase
LVYIAPVEGLWELDQSLFKAIHLGWHREWLDPFFWVISSTGLGYVQVILVLFFIRWRDVLTRARERRTVRRIPSAIAMPALVKWRDLRDLAGPMLITFGVAGIVNGAIKKAVPRDRPSNFVWAEPQEGFYGNSFSSGHTATSVALAVTVFIVTRGTPRAWYGWVALLWAGLVGISRIYRGVHWPSDVVSGAAVGAACAAIVCMVLRNSKAGWAQNDAEAETSTEP